MFGGFFVARVVCNFFQTISFPWKVCRSPALCALRFSTPSQPALELEIDKGRRDTAGPKLKPWKVDTHTKSEPAWQQNIICISGITVQAQKCFGLIPNDIHIASQQRLQGRLVTEAVAVAP